VVPPGAEVLREWVRGQGLAGDVRRECAAAVLADRAAYRERVSGWLDVAEQVKASEDDLRWLYPGEEPGAVVQRWIRDHGIVGYW